MAYHSEKTSSGTDIVIDGWESGISANPYTGIADMRNIENVSIPGEASVALSTQAMITQGAISGVTFTVNAATDTFTYNGTVPIETNTVITVSNSGGGLPGGLAVNTAYYVVNPTTTTFQVSSIGAGGSVLDITTTGTGTQLFSTIQIGTPKYYDNTLVTFSGNNVFLYFMLDSNGRVWVLDNANLSGSNKWVYTHNQNSETGLLNGDGLVSYHDYLFWFDDSNINVLPIINFSFGNFTLTYLTTRASWIRAWQTTTSTAVGNMSHQAIIGVNDNAMYFCNGIYVGSLFTAIPIGGIPPTSSYGEIFNIASTHSIATGSTTNGGNNLTTGSAFFTASDVGAVITGAGIPIGAYIQTLVNSTTVIISDNATATASGLTFTITSGYVYNPQALAIPTNDFATCLAELGVNLLVGGVNNYIYPWDRVSTGYSPAIFLSENYTTRMVTVNTTTYIFCGFRGRVYLTNGSNVNSFYEIPDYLANTTDVYISWTDAVFNRNQLYFGFQVTKNDGTTVNQYGGLWTLNLGVVSALSGVSAAAAKLQNIMSYGTYSGYVNAITTNRGLNTLVKPANDGYGLYIGWNDGSVGGIDKGVSAPYTGSQAYVVSDMIPIGNFYDKKNFANIQYKLSTALVAGESVTLYWREKITDSFTLLGTSNTVGFISEPFAVNFANLQWIQIKAVLNSTASSPSFVRLEQLRIH